MSVTTVSVTEGRQRKVYVVTANDFPIHAFECKEDAEECAARGNATPVGKGHRRSYYIVWTFDLLTELPK